MDGTVRLRITGAFAAILTATALVVVDHRHPTELRPVCDALSATVQVRHKHGYLLTPGESFSPAAWREFADALGRLEDAARWSRHPDAIEAAALARRGYRGVLEAARRPVTEYVQPVHLEQADVLYNPRLDKQADIANRQIEGNDGIFDLGEICTASGFSFVRQHTHCPGVATLPVEEQSLVETPDEILSRDELADRLPFRPVYPRRLPAPDMSELITAHEPHNSTYSYRVHYGPPGWNGLAGTMPDFDSSGGLSLLVTAIPVDGAPTVKNVSSNMQQRLHVGPVNGSPARAILNLCHAHGEESRSVQWRVDAPPFALYISVSGSLVLEELHRIAESTSAG